MGRIEQVNVSVSVEERDAWRAAAEAAGVSLSAFVRRAVHRAITDAPSITLSVSGSGSVERAGATSNSAAGCRNQQRHKAGIRCSYCGQTP